MFKQRLLSLMLLSVLVIGQSSAQNDNLDATLWMQTAAEYKASCIQAYALAKIQLDRALADPSWSAATEQKGDFSKLPPAVILDVDETVMDNSAFQGELIKRGITYNGNLWDEWLSMVKATAIPGALDFIEYATSKGVAVFYVTNRTCIKRDGSDCPQKKETLDNLKALGFPVSAERLMLKRELPGWGSDKVARRTAVAKDHRVLLLLGDNFGDFIGGVKGFGVTAAGRDKVADQYHDWWGVRWIVLPNPSYGSWLRVLGNNKQAAMRAFPEKAGSENE